MDLGDYLYLIIFLGVTLFQFVSRSLGKKEIKRQETHEKKSEPLKSKEIIKDEIYTMNTPFREKIRVNDYVNSEFCSSISSIDILQNETKSGIDSVPDKCENKKSFLNLSNTDELKKAVIYGEILKQKF